MRPLCQPCFVCYHARLHTFHSTLATITSPETCCSVSKQAAWFPFKQQLPKRLKNAPSDRPSAPSDTGKPRSFFHSAGEKKMRIIERSDLNECGCYYTGALHDEHNQHPTMLRGMCRYSHLCFICILPENWKTAVKGFMISASECKRYLMTASY